VRDGSPRRDRWPRRRPQSVFADRLARWLGGVPIIHTDDFASWDDQFDRWDRLENEVLTPLAEGKPAWYQAYDWARRELGGWRDPPAADVVLLEGVSSARRAASGRLSLSIWVEAPPDERSSRGLQRDGPSMRGQWQRWMADEDARFAKDGTRHERT
jgi:hypothetical protein